MRQLGNDDSPPIITYCREIWGGAKMTDKLRLFVTRSGREIPLRPIATKTLDDLQILIQQVENIRPPTYTVKILDEDIEEIEHDLTTLKTAEDRIAWEAYEQRVATASAEVNRKVTNAYIVFGVVMEPPDDGWEEDFEFCGIPVPVGATERKVFYVERVLLADPADQRDFVQRVYLISQLTGEALERADALFRGAVEDGKGLDSLVKATGQTGAVAA